jgi:hypothetical protein
MALVLLLFYSFLLFCSFPYFQMSITVIMKTSWIFFFFIIIISFSTFSLVASITSPPGGNGWVQLPSSSFTPRVYAAYSGGSPVPPPYDPSDRSGIAIFGGTNDPNAYATCYNDLWILNPQVSEVILHFQVPLRSLLLRVLSFFSFLFSSISSGSSSSFCSIHSYPSFLPLPLLPLRMQERMMVDSSLKLKLTTKLLHREPLLQLPSTLLRLSSTFMEVSMEPIGTQVRRS